MIELMKMVGATVGVIRRPFVIEGVLQGAVAAVLATGLLLGLTGFLQGRVQELVALSAPSFLLFVLFGAFLGGIGSAVSLQGFLRRW
jgi:cell division transport system permease protein